MVTGNARDGNSDSYLRRVKGIRSNPHMVAAHWPNGFARCTRGIMDRDNRVKQYRDRAAELRKLAEGVHAPWVKGQFLEMASQFDRLATDVERERFE